MRSYTALVATAMTLGVASPVVAQGGVQFGVRGGVSVASVSFSAATFDPDNRTGFVGGPFVNFDFGALGLQVAGQFHQMGFESPLADLDISYIDIPVVLKLGVPLAVIKPSVFGGAAVGFRQSCDLNGTSCASNSFERTNTSGIAGADVAIYLGGVSLWADARYTFGLTDINGVFGAVTSLKNRSWNLTGGIGFNL